MNIIRYVDVSIDPKPSREPRRESTGADRIEEPGLAKKVWLAQLDRYFERLLERR